jgi:hypothetical protein
MNRTKVAVLGIVGAVALVAAIVVAAQAGGFGRRAPEQPIPFRHDLHAGENQIPCMYCHFSADRSVSAGIPSVATCAGCHIPGGVPLVARDSLGVRQLIQYYQQGVPIPWVRIYKVPDHVRFPHMLHVNAGVQCQECHGPVETMREVYQASSLQMGWCLSCHREREARTDCFVCHY